MDKTIDSLLPNTSYEARTAAAGDGSVYGDSEFSVTATFTTDVSELGEVSQTIDGLSGGTDYELRIAGRGDYTTYGDSEYGETVTFTTLDAPGDGSVVSATITALSPDTDYEAVVVARGDDVEFEDSDASDVIAFKTLPDYGTVHFTLENLDPGTEYEAAVCAKGDGITYDNSDYCDAVTFTTLGARWWEARHYNVITDVCGANEPERNWDCLFEVIGVDEDNQVRAGQAITILARVFDAFYPDTLLLNRGDNITSITYTCERRTTGVFTVNWTPVDGHEDVAVDLSCLMSELELNERWTRDEKGFNFVLTPDITQYPLFAELGHYRIRVRVVPTAGNPVVFYSYLTVVDDPVKQNRNS